MEGKTDDRWRELAELLGVPEEGAPVARNPIPGALPPEPLPPPRPFAPPVAPVEEEEGLPPELDEPVFAPAPVESELGWEEEFDEDDGPPDEVEVEPILQETAPPGEEAGGERPGDEEKPRRGRRRRRRGKRRGDGERPETKGTGSEPVEPAPARPAVKQSDHPREEQNRGRGRGQRGRRDDDEPRHRRDERPQPEPVSSIPDADDPPLKPRVLAEDTDFSDWTVPSWQDLIASLYRPDR